MKTLDVKNSTCCSRLRRALLVIAPALIIAVLTPVSSIATPPCSVLSENLLEPVQAGFFADGSLKLMCNEFRDLGWMLRMNVKGDSDLYITRHTFPVEAHTGWHTHPGPSLITVISGELTVYESADPSCTPTVYHAGESFTDIGCGDVHLVRNEGTVCAVDVAVQLVPAGQPRRIDANQPANCPTFICASPTPCPQ